MSVEKKRCRSFVASIVSNFPSETKLNFFIRHTGNFVPLDHFVQKKQEIVTIFYMEKQTLDRNLTYTVIMFSLLSLMYLLFGVCQNARKLIKFENKHWSERWKKRCLSFVASVVLHFPSETELKQFIKNKHCPYFAYKKKFKKKQGVAWSCYVHSSILLISSYTTLPYIRNGYLFTKKINSIFGFKNKIVVGIIDSLWCPWF